MKNAPEIDHFTAISLPSCFIAQQFKKQKKNVTNCSLIYSNNKSHDKSHSLFSHECIQKSLICLRILPRTHTLAHIFYPFCHNHQYLYACVSQKLIQQQQRQFRLTIRQLIAHGIIRSPARDSAHTYRERLERTSTDDNFLKKAHLHHHHHMQTSGASSLLCSFLVVVV